jgi:DNA mismatch endonuclease, patch repair protein
MDNLTPEHRRKNMRNIRSSNTKVELLVAGELRKQKIYCARNVKTIPGKPDFAFRRKKVVVFIDSDFWHGHIKRFIMPKSNCEYWNQKIQRNRIRDKEVNKRLREDGWKVVRIWEKDINYDLNKSIQKILNVL